MPWKSRYEKRQTITGHTHSHNDPAAGSHTHDRTDRLCRFPDCRQEAKWCDTHAPGKK